MERSAGVIMHIASLPGKFGIGTFGKEAYEYVEFLVKSGLKYWQILPLGQTGYGDSPYQSFSAFAGNPYFIDFDILNKEGLLRQEEYINENYGDNPEYIDYGLLFKVKYSVLRKAYNNLPIDESVVENGHYKRLNTDKSIAQYKEVLRRQLEDIGEPLPSMIAKMETFDDYMQSYKSVNFQNEYETIASQENLNNTSEQYNN